MQEEAKPESMLCLISVHEVKATGLLVRCQKKLQLPRATEDKGELCLLGCWVEYQVAVCLSNVSLVPEL